MAAAALALSCQKENPSAPASNPVTITVQAAHELDAPTKVTVGELADGVCPVLWQTGDAIKMINYVSTDAKYKEQVGSGTVEASDNGSSTAKITVSVDESVVIGTTKVKFLLDNGQTFGKPIVPSEQTQTGIGADNTNFFDYTYAYTVGTSTVQASIWRFSLHHPFSYVKIPLKSSVYAGYALKSVTLTNLEASSKESGYPSGQISNVNHTISSGNGNLLQGYVAGTTSEKVTVSYSQTVQVSEGSQDAWIVALPTAIKADEPAETVYLVTVVMEKNGTEVTAEVKFKTILYPSAVNVLKVGEITEADIKK